MEASELTPVLDPDIPNTPPPIGEAQYVESALQSIHAVQSPPTPPPLKKVTKHAKNMDIIDLLLFYESKGEKIPLAKLLKDEGFSTEIYDMDFRTRTLKRIIGKKTEYLELFKKISWEGIHFKNCQFPTDVKFADEELKNISFTQCTFPTNFFVKTKIHNCQFHRCVFKGAHFTHAHLTSILFKNCTIKESSFEGSHLEDVIFDHVQMPGTHFFNTSIHRTTIKHSLLANTLFFDSLNAFDIDQESQKTISLTKPIITLLEHPMHVGTTVPEVLKELRKKFIVLRICSTPQDINELLLEQEVETMLKGVKKAPMDTMPIAQQLMQKVQNNPELYPESTKIFQKAAKLSQRGIPFVLPGGEDIPPALYGEKDTDSSWDNWSHPMFEIALLHQAHHKGMPMMGICRGFQMTNVYFGAKMEQDMGHSGSQVLMPQKDTTGSLYGKIFEKKLAVVSMHSQGIMPEKGPSQYLEITSKKDGLIKASEPSLPRSVPMILLQFHPEHRDENAKFSKNNKKFWKILKESVTTFNARRAVTPEKLIAQQKKLRST